MSGLGEILTELREDKGLTQRELAKEFHVSGSTISAYEIGKRPPSIEMLIAYAEYFDVTTDYLLGLTQSADSLSSFADEFVPGKTVGMVMHEMKKLRPEQKEAIIVVLNNMRFYAEVTGRTETGGEKEK